MAALALAALAGGTVASIPTAQAQAPAAVPVARFYGHVTQLPGGGSLPVGNTPMTAAINGRPCDANSTQTGGINNTGVDNAGNYAIDIQAIPGCTTPGSTVVFSEAFGAAGGTRTAIQRGTIPDLPGTAVHLDLTFPAQATPTPTARPATPAPSTPAPSTAPPPPPPPTTATAPRPAASPVTQRGVAQAPKGPVGAQGPAAAPRLPNTGTGGLLDQQSSTSPQAEALLLLIVLAALGVSASGLVAYRRSR